MMFIKASFELTKDDLNYKILKRMYKAQGYRGIKLRALYKKQDRIIRKQAKAISEAIDKEIIRQIKEALWL